MLITPSMRANDFLSWAAMRKTVRNLHGLGPTLARSGSLELRLATQKKEIKKAQKLRYKVFFEEREVAADTKSRLLRRDLCAFDRICDHLLVIDHDARNRFGQKKPKTVGCYRLLRQDVADAHTGFYSASEFDLSPMLRAQSSKNLLELGRSCVLSSHRSSRTIELLWRGISRYVDYHKIDAMFGCASFHGVSPQDIADQLSFLHHHACVAPDWSVTPHAAMRAKIDLMPPEAAASRRVINKLPPLIKAYLRVGARFGQGAVIDHAFGTTDVFVVVPVAEIESRYMQRFSGQTALTLDA